MRFSGGVALVGLGGWWAGSRCGALRRVAVLVVTVGTQVTLVCPVDPAGGPGGPPAGCHGADGVGDQYFPQDGNGGYDVRHYALDLRYDPATQRLTGRARLSVTATRRLCSFSLDFGVLKIASLEVRGAPARWRRAGEHELAIIPARRLGPGERFVIDVRYAGVPRPGGAVLRTTDGIVIAGEPHSATDWFPANDHPSDKAAYDISLTVPNGLTAISNGTLHSSGPAGPGWTTWHWRHRQPMASYLAMAVIGRYRVVSTPVARCAGSGPVELTAIAEPVPVERAAAVLARSCQILDFLAERFGRYPFDAVGGVVVDSRAVPFTLETQTRPIYGSDYFDGADEDRMSLVVAHELAHQWFGNSVSLRSWRDIWLNEGFATYAEWLWAEQLGIYSVSEIFESTYDGSVQMWQPPPGDPGVAELFARSVYRRGAMTLHALRLEVGDPAFFAILRHWADRKRFGTGDTAEFVALAERVSGQSLRELFDSWLYGVARPARPAAARVAP